MNLWKLHISREEASIAFMQEYYAQNITCQTLSSRVYLSDGYFNKIFKKITGESRFHFLQSIRITKATNLLLSTSLPIATMASRVGYADMKYFYEIFKRQYGLTPKQYRDQMLHSLYASRL